ncbi:hypothetical protein D3C75_783290 [compost metagenome]
MVSSYIIPRVIEQIGLGVLEILLMPVELVQGIVDVFLLVQLEAQTQQEVGGHKQGVGPGLLREVVIRGNGVLEYAFAEADGFLAQVLSFHQSKIQVLLVACRFVQGNHGMSHGAGIHHQRRDAQLQIFIHPFDKEIDIFLVAGYFPSLGDAVKGNTAGPVPGEVNIHCSADNTVD